MRPFRILRETSFEALRPAACPRDPVILLQAPHYCSEKELPGSHGQAAGRRRLICRQILLCYFMMLFFIINTSFAAPDESIVKLNDYLVQEKINLTKANNEIKIIVESDKGMNESELKSRQQRNATLQSLISSKIAILDDFFLDFKKQQQNLSQRLKALQQLPLDKIENNQVIEDRANQISALKDENNKIIQLISEGLELAKNYQTTLIADKQRLDLIQANMTEQQHLDQLREQIKGLQRERDDLYQANIGLQQAIKDNGSFEENLNLEAQLLLNNQTIILLQHHIVELVFQKKTHRF